VREARVNGRSLNSEIIARLDQSFNQAELTDVLRNAVFQGELADIIRNAVFQAMSAK
jgi:hypothetical protein